jgi:hypothetical protein
MLTTYFFAVLGFTTLTFAQTMTSATPGVPGHGQACPEGELKCLFVNNDGSGGDVFRCTDGLWQMFQDCSSSERCVTSPTPHCNG